MTRYQTAQHVCGDHFPDDYWALQHTSAAQPSIPDAAAPSRFKRPGGWTATQVACLDCDHPYLLEDPNLACWWRKIVETASKDARDFINQAFPENRHYSYSRLPQWPTVLPWIAPPRGRRQALATAGHCNAHDAPPAAESSHALATPCDRLPAALGPPQCAPGRASDAPAIRGA